MANKQTIPVPPCANCKHRMRIDHIEPENTFSFVCYLFPLLPILVTNDGPLPNVKNCEALEPKEEK